MTEEQVIALLRRACDAAGSRKAWAHQHAISAVYVSDVLSGRRAPAGKILAALGIERQISYRKMSEGRASEPA